jgi:hypothetical protein
MLRILIGINNDFQISVPHHSTHYTLQGTGDMFNTVNNKRHPRLISPTNHFPHMYHVRARDNMNRVEKFTD